MMAFLLFVEITSEILRAHIHAEDILEYMNRYKQVRHFTVVTIKAFPKTGSQSSVASTVTTCEIEMFFNLNY